MAKKNKNYVAIDYSIQNGDLHQIAGVDYYGRNPQFERLSNGQIVKVAKGIPFVNATVK